MKRILQLLPCLYFCLVSAWCQAQEPIIISFPETEVQPNATFCIDVQATHFTDLSGIQFALEWEEGLLNYQSINIYAGENVPYIPNLNELPSFAVNGNELRFLWTVIGPGESITLPEKSTLFQICFRAANEDGSASIKLSDAIVGEGVRTSDLASIPVIGEDANIDINTDAGVTNDATFSIGSKEVNSGQNFCVPITAYNFKAISDLQFSLAWDQGQLFYDRVELVETVLNIREENYNFDGEELRFQWNEFNAESIPLPDEHILFQVCFDAIGDLGTQTEINFGNAISFDAIRWEGSEEIDILAELESGIINITGEATEDVPTLLITDAIVEPNEDFCLPVLAQDMLPLAGLQFELTWNKELLKYNSIKVEEDILGLGMQSSDYSFTEDAFRLAWLNRDAQTLELEQTQVLFELCFTALGTYGEQTTVDFGDNVVLEATTIEDNIPAVFDVIASAGIVIFGSNVANVYPGDTDLNQEVNHYDLINIGLGYGQTGSTRDNASLDYTPQPAEDWATSTPITNINYKYADTDGNGTVESDDIEAINLNWSSLPTLVNTAFTEEGVPFYIDTDTLRLIEENQLPIILGSEVQIAESVYSIAFSIYYEAEVMLEEGLNISFENSWLGDAENELISVQRFFPNEKRIDVAISRIDQEGRTGFGEIGALNIVMEDVILFQGEREVKFTIDHVKAIGGIGEEVMTVSAKSSIAPIQQTPTATDKLFDEVIQIYPNPASSHLTIVSENLNVERIVVRDVLGKRISIAYSSNRLNVEALSSGIYFFTIYTDKGSLTKKVTIQ